MILKKIANDTMIRVQEQKQCVSPEQMASAAYQCESDTGFPMVAALRQPGLSFICEVKKASPSKGIIADSFPYLQIAREYQASGAAAISVLTEPKHFLGQNKYLEEIAQAVEIPVLRKDFVVDPYQIYEAKVIGADALLLICAILDEARLKDYLKLAHELGMSAIVEAHTADEVAMALYAGAEIVGVNNRHLQTFEVDMRTSLHLRELVPRDRIFVSESGIRTPEDIRQISQAGADAVLIGESLMRSSDRNAALAHLKSLLPESEGV